MQRDRNSWSRMESSVCTAVGTELSFTDVPDVPASHAATGTVARKGWKRERWGGGLIKANRKRDPTSRHTEIYQSKRTTKNN